MNKITASLIIINLLFCFSNCKNNSTKADVNATIPDEASQSDDLFLIQPPPEYYRPSGLRPLNLVEQYKLGKNGLLTNTFPLKDKFGKSARWDTMLSSPVPIFLQVYVDENNQPTEGVVYEMNDTIQGLIMRVRFAHSGE